MSYNFLAYCMYLPIAFYITWNVGRDLHAKGRIYIEDCFPNDFQLAHTLNNFLLTGYYLLNLGYAAVALGTFDNITNYYTLTEELLFRLGIIILSLGIIHYTNLIVLIRFKNFIRKIFSTSHF